MLVARENIQYVQYIMCAGFQCIFLQCQTRSVLALNTFISSAKHVPLQHKTRSLPAKAELVSSDKCVSLFLAINNTVKCKCGLPWLKLCSSPHLWQPRLNLYVEMIVFSYYK